MLKKSNYDIVSILEYYWFLMHVYTVQVAQEFALILGNAEIRRNEDFVAWSKAVIQYCKERQVKSTTLQLVVESYSKDCEPCMLIMHDW